MNADEFQAMDVERLMMDALDGMLNERDRRLLNAYLAQHPVERAMFERMRDVDRSLQSTPPISAPRQLSRHILSAVAHTRMEQPSLRAAQAIFLIIVACVLVLLAGVLVMALYSLFSPAFPQAELMTTFAFLRGLAEFAASALTVGVAILRAIFTLPIAWLILVGLVGIVVLWLRVMFVVMNTDARTTPA